MLRYVESAGPVTDPETTAQETRHDLRPEAMTRRPPEALAPGSAPTDALTVAGGWEIDGLPALVRRAGPKAAERVVEFFTAQIRNANTRAASALKLEHISPIAVATYLDALQATASAPTVKQHLAAIRTYSTGWSSARSCRLTRRPRSADPRTSSGKSDQSDPRGVEVEPCATSRAVTRKGTFGRGRSGHGGSQMWVTRI